MTLHRLQVLPAAALLLAAAACTPGLDASCKADADCQTGSFCREGICIPAGNLPDGDPNKTDGGGSVTPPDGGDGGGVVGGGSVSIAIAEPGKDAWVSQSVHVRATVGGTDPIDRVNVTYLVDGASRGSVALHSTTRTFEGNFDTPGSNSLAAKFVFEAYRPGETSAAASAEVAVRVDLVAPTISTTYDGGWVSGTSVFPIDAAVGDIGSSAVAAGLVLLREDGGTLPPLQGLVNGSNARFSFDASQFRVDGGVAVRPFQLTVTDNAGNVGHADGGAPIGIDDEPPAISVAVPSQWVDGGTAVVTVSADDGRGSGVASEVLAVDGARLPLQAAQGGGWTSNFDASSWFSEHKAFEGTVPVTFQSTDAVGNSANAAKQLQLDNVPPLVRNLAISTAPDYVDATGTRWYKLDPASGPIRITGVADPLLGAPLDLVASALTQDGSGPCATNVAALLGPGPFSFDALRCGENGRDAALAQIALVDQAGNPTTTSIAFSLDGVPPAVQEISPATNVWVARSAGTTTLVVSATDGESGVSSLYAQGHPTPMTVATDGTASDVVDVSAAPRFRAGALPVPVRAVDNVGNEQTVTIPLNVDDSAPAFAADPTDESWSTWHRAGGTGTSALQFDAFFTLTEFGAGIDTVSARMGGAYGPVTLQRVGGSETRQAWKATFALPSNASIETDAVTFVLESSDRAQPVGNSGSSTFKLKLDNNPPRLSNATLVTQPDGAVDGNGVRWFQGGAQASSPVVATVSVVEPFPQATSAYDAATGAKLADATCTGTAPNLSCTFNLPRASTSGKQVVLIDSIDQAGNRLAVGSGADVTCVNCPTLVLYYDNATSSSLAPTMVQDTTWYPRSASTVVPVVFKLASAPASGMQTATLTAGGTKYSPATVSSDGTTYTFQVPTTYAPSAAEGAAGLVADFQTWAGVQTTASGALLVDDVPPSVQLDAGPFYPAALSGVPAAWGQDGSRYPLGTGVYDVARFKVVDCGSGVGTLAPSTGALQNNSARVDSSSPATCAGTDLAGNPLVATATKVTVTADTNSEAAWAIPTIDGTVDATLKVTDKVGLFTSNKLSFNVTHRRFIAPVTTPSRVVLGPSVFVASTEGLLAIDAQSGARSAVITSTRPGGPIVGGTSANPLLFWAEGSNIKVASASAPYPTLSTCAVGNSGASGLMLSSGTSVNAVGVTVTTTPVTCYQDCSDYTCGPKGIACCPIQVCSGGDTTRDPVATALSFNGSAWSCTDGNLDLASTSVRGQGSYFYSVGSPVIATGPSRVTSALNATSMIATGYLDRNTDLILGASSRVTFSGSAFGSVNAMTMGQYPVVGSAGLLSYEASGWQLRSLNGGAVGSPLPMSGGASVAPILERGNKVMLANGPDLDVVAVSSTSGLGSAPAAVFANAFGGNTPVAWALGARMLYAAAGNQIYALSVPSSGVSPYVDSTSTIPGWPAQDRDSCGSRNLTYSCPY